MRKDQGITDKKKADIKSAIDSSSICFANWLLENAVIVQPNFVGYWRYRKDNRLHTTNRMYQLFKAEPTQIDQKNEFVIPDVSVAKRTVCGKESKTCRFLIPSSNGCDYIHNCEFKQTER